MANWVNYGDVNFIEHGGTMVMKDAEAFDFYEFIQANPAENERMYAFRGSLHMEDFRRWLPDIAKSMGVDEKEIKEKGEAYAAACIVDYIGAEQLNAFPINYTNSGITRYELYKSMKEYDSDIDVHYEPYKYLKNADLDVLADKIETYCYDRGEYDRIGKDRLPWLDADDDRTESENSIKEALHNSKDAGKIEKYFENEVNEMDEQDELLEKADMLKDIVADMAEKMRSKKKDDYTK